MRLAHEIEDNTTPLSHKLPHVSRHRPFVGRAHPIHRITYVSNRPRGKWYVIGHPCPCRLHASGQCGVHMLSVVKAY